MTTEIKKHYAKLANTFRSNIFLFTSLATAQNFASTSKKPMRVILGEANHIIVCLPREAENLVKAGYQYAA